MPSRAGEHISVIVRADGSGATVLHEYKDPGVFTGDFGATSADGGSSSDTDVLQGGSTGNPKSSRVAGTDGSEVWTRPFPIETPDWAPRGDVIAYQANGEIHLLDAATVDHERVFMPLPAGLAVTGFTWMPDGTSIAFAVA